MTEQGKLRKFEGRVLFLTEDTSLIRRQLEAVGDEARQLEDELAARLGNDDPPTKLRRVGYVFITTRRWASTFTLACAMPQSRRTK